MSLREIEEPAGPCAGPAHEIGVEADGVLVIEFDGNAFERKVGFFCSFPRGDDGIGEERPVIHGGTSHRLGRRAQAQEDAKCGEDARHW